MRLCFKQKIFSFWGSYDIYNEYGETVYTVKGVPSFGSKFVILDSNGNELGFIKQELFHFPARFGMYANGNYMGSISKQFTFFKPKFNIDFNSWHISGDFAEWNYTILDGTGVIIATADKELFNFSDTYNLHVQNPADALFVLMIVIAIDAEKARRN